jgi:AraC family transcriptional regulator
MLIPTDIKIPASLHCRTDNNEPPAIGKIARREADLLGLLHSPDRVSQCRVHEESKWRAPDVITGGDQSSPRLIASHWSGDIRHEMTSETTDDYYMLSISLQPSQFSLRLGNAEYPNKNVVPGTIQLTEPALPARIVYHAPYDVLHLHIQGALLKECFEWAHGQRAKGDVTLRDPRFAHDPLIERLGCELLSAGKIDGAYGELYAGSLSLAIVARLLALYGEAPASTSRRDVGALPKWRLKRAIEFMEGHDDERITLAELAQSAGLSRMHFAAQFRKATGQRPHQYILHRRIEKAKAMLAQSDVPIAELALKLKFSSQAHFTTVFRRIAGSTPHCWRQCNRD